MKIQIFTTAAACALFSVSAVAQDATATYDFQSGALVFDITGSSVGAIGIESVGNVDTTADVGSLSALGGAIPLPAGQLNEDSIGYVAPLIGPNISPFDVGSYNIGTVLAPGLDSGDMTFSYSLVGVGQAPVFVDVEVVNVPEPGSLALLGLGGVALLRRRRQG